MLHKYWFEFDISLADSPPPGTLLGCGVTAVSKEQAITILKDRVFRTEPLPKIRRYVQDIDLALLDHNHVVPNMSNPDRAGIWFPLGYE